MARNDTILESLNQLTNWGFLTTDLELRITGWSHWLEVNSGRQAEDVIHRKLFEVFPDLLTRRLDVFYEHALQGRVVVLAQQLHGHLLPMPTSLDATSRALMQQSVRLAPLMEEGAIVGTLTVIEDVTDRVNAESELAAQARQQLAIATLGQLGLAGGDLQLFMDKMASIVADTLQSQFAAVVQLATAGQHTLLRAGHGWKEDEAASAMEALVQSSVNATDSREPVIIQGDQDLQARPLKNHGIVSGIVLPIFVGNARRGVVGVYSHTPRIFTEDNVQFLRAVAHVLGLAMERNRLETELRYRVDELGEGNRRKDEFLAMLAHELRNPLAPIRNALHIISLITQEPRDDVRRAYGIIERQIENLVRLVDDLLDVSRITSGKIQLQKERVDLASIVDRAVEGAKPLIDARRHTLEVILAKEPVWVEGDPLRLAQVLWNLLNNAAKYTPEGGRITLTVSRQESAEVRIRDTGMGIHAGMLPRIFELFTQMERTIDRAEGGLGVGLTLVRRLTEMHGGTVEVTSKGPGQGAEFIVRLPLMAADSGTANPSVSQTSQHVAAPNQRIMVVDDNRDSAESLAMLLRFLGNEVRTVHDGILAVALAESYCPNVVLLDIGLPGLNGLEVCKRLRKHPFQVQPLIIAMTGYGQEEDRVRSDQAGFDAHLVKPVDLATLQSLLCRRDFSRNGNAENTGS